MNLEIQSIGIESVEKLSKVATKAYFDHYKHLWHDDGTWYVDKCFNINQLSTELQDKSNLIFLAIFEEKPVGFLKLRPENQLIEESGKGLEIERIYLIKEVTGRGFGRKLMEFAIEFANKQHKDYVWLKAMDSSKDAIRFYESLGFEICGTSQLDFTQMKTEYLGMVTMRRK
jgi:diamine N-acetyltransferase